jgi:hypothetical protein
MTQFILAGFIQDAGFRVFSFEGQAADRSRTKYTVRTDLDLVRKYGIRVQELPLLCRGLLERIDETDQERTWTFTEEEMRRHAAGCASVRDAAQRKKSARKPAPTSNGAGWRAPQPW